MERLKVATQGLAAGGRRVQSAWGMGQRAWEAMEDPFEEAWEAWGDDGHGHEHGPGHGHDHH